MTAQFKQSGSLILKLKLCLECWITLMRNIKINKLIALRKQIQNKFVEDFDQKYSLTAKLKLTKKKKKK